VGGSKIWCSVALQPYLHDALRGREVPLTSDRFVLRPIEQYIDAAPDGAGWTARGESRMGLRFRYEVVDKKTGSIVLRNEATLACADRPTAPAARAPEVMSLGEPAAGPWRSPPWTPSIHAGGGLEMLAGGAIVEPRTLGVYPVFTFGLAVHYGALWIPLRYGLGSGGKQVIVLYGNLGVGLRAEVGKSLELHAAPTLRGSTMDGGDIGATVGFRVNFSPRKEIGGGLTVDASAPIAGDRWWLFTAGVGLWAY
jgi:hypothetical protein